MGLNALFIVLPHLGLHVIGSHAYPPSHIVLTPGSPVMIRGPYYILSTMQAGTTTISRVFGMTAPHGATLVKPILELPLHT